MLVIYLHVRSCRPAGLFPRLTSSSLLSPPLGAGGAAPAAALRGLCAATGRTFRRIEKVRKSIDRQAQFGGDLGL